jgi:uncharacterized protein (DUF58 family)
VITSKNDITDERFRLRGAAVSLNGLLLQRHAAKTLEYPANARSIAGISGVHLSKIRGRGIDFEEFRPYQSGDDIRLIDWKVTARTGRAVTKVFREERERPVIIAVDQTRNMYFGSQTAFKSVIAAQAAALLCWRALDNGDRVGGLVFSDNASALIRPRRSRLSALHLLNKITEYNQCIKNFSLESRYDNSSGLSPSLSSALSGIRRITKPGSTLYVVSDFANLDKLALDYLKQLARSNNVVAVMIYDALEQNLPVPGMYGITDGVVKGSLNTHNKQIRERYNSEFILRMKSLKSDFEEMKIRLMTLRTNQLVVEQVRQWIVKNY